MELLIRLKLRLDYLYDYLSYNLNNNIFNNFNIYLIDNNKIENVTFRYYLSKAPLIKYGFNNYTKKNYYCIIRNKYGICKTIFNNRSFYYINKIKNSINIEDKIDGLFDNKIMIQIKLIKNNNKEIEITKKLINTDKNINLSFNRFLDLNKIKYSVNSDKIYIKYINNCNFQEISILDNLNNYIDKPINKII
jgi:hypothetical protein